MRFAGSSFHPQHPARTDRELVTAYTCADEGNLNLSRLQRQLLRRIAKYQQRTRHFDEQGEVQSRNKCPYAHNCSDFTADAIREFGSLRGGFQGFMRLHWRCTPWGVRRAKRETGLNPLENLKERSAFLNLMHDLHHVLIAVTPYQFVYLLCQRAFATPQPKRDTVGGILLDIRDKTGIGQTVNTKIKSQRGIA